MNRLIKRILVLCFYLFGLAVLLYGLGTLYSYLNTGAERSKMLYTDLIQATTYTPKLQWVQSANEGRPIDQQTRKILERDYLNAWEVRNIALQTNDSTGIDDYYTEQARTNISNIIELNKANAISIEGTSLSHQPEVLFYSEDGQMAVLKDHQVKEFARVLKNQELLSNDNEISSYHATLLLEDGFWRIRHLIKDKVLNTSPDTARTKLDQLNIKGINYYPQDTPWDMFGKAFNLETIDQDFKIIREAGLNTVRIFIQHQDFGSETIDQNKLKKLLEVLDTASQNKLKVIVTLFDFYGDYSVLNWTLNQKHADVIVTALKDHKALLAWDIKNEPNLDFESRGEQLVTSWLSNMIDFIKTVDSNTPVTIGWSNTISAPILSDKVDFVSFHYYEDLNKLKTAYEDLRKRIPDVPIVLGEFGMSSYRGIWKPFGNSKKTQANYHQEIQTIIHELDIPFISWTLYDFTSVPKAVVGSLPWRRNVQKQFGFIDKSGQKKPAFNYISSPN